MSQAHIPQITQRDPADLRPHPLHKDVPKPDKDSAEWRAFVDSIDAGGIIHPLIVTRTGQVMDGVRRWLAARQLQLDQVPCIERPETEAATLMVETLMHRRHMTRGAAVYLLLPSLQDYVDGAEQRRLANLARGRKIMQKPLIFPKASTLGFEDVAELAEHFGVTGETIRLAVYVRRLLYEPKCDRLAALHRDCRIKQPPLERLQELQVALRAEFEPALLDGTKNLWNVRSGIAGKLSTEDHPKIPHQLELCFDRTMRSLTSQVSRSEDPEPLIRDYVKQTNVKPEDLERLAEFGAALAREARQQLRLLKVHEV
jgi:hypothetical protein